MENSPNTVDPNMAASAGQNVVAASVADQSAVAAFSAGQLASASGLNMAAAVAGQGVAASMARQHVGHVSHVNPAAEKPEKFSGQNFKRWQQKMFFYLTTLNLARFLKEDAPVPKEGETDFQVISAIDAWKHSEFLCRNYVLNGLSDSLYSVYAGIKQQKGFGNL